MVDTETYTIESPDGDSNDFRLPVGLVDALAEQGDQKSTVVGDIALMAFAQRAHAMVHHSEGETPADVEAIADEAEDLFEERFGVSFSEAMGHSH